MPVGDALYTVMAFSPVSSRVLVERVPLPAAEDYPEGTLAYCVSNWYHVLEVRRVGDHVRWVRLEDGL